MTFEEFMVETKRRLSRSARGSANQAYLEYAAWVGLKWVNAEAQLEATKAALKEASRRLDMPLDLEAHAAVTPTPILVRELAQRAKRAIFGAPSRIFVHR